LCLFVHGFERLVAFDAPHVAAHLPSEQQRKKWHTAFSLPARIHCHSTFPLNYHTGGNLTQILLKYCVSIVLQQFNDCQQMTVLCREDSGGNKFTTTKKTFSFDDSRSDLYT